MGCVGRNCSGVGCTDLDPTGCDGSRITKPRPGHSQWLGREDKGKRQALKHYLECKGTFPLITWSSLQGEGVQLLSPSCVAQECGMAVLRMEPTMLAGSSLCASIHFLSPETLVSGTVVEI